MTITWDKSHVTSVCNIVEIDDIGVGSTGCCTMIYITIPPHSGESSTGCCAMVSTTIPPDSGAFSTGCYTMVSPTLLTKPPYSQATNRIITLHNLESTINQFVALCPTCKSVLKFEEKHNVLFDTTLEIMCIFLNQKEKKERQKVRNLKRIITNMKNTSLLSLT